jgi:hypothetical protein
MSKYRTYVCHREFLQLKDRLHLTKSKRRRRMRIKKMDFLMHKFKR